MDTVTIHPEQFVSESSTSQPAIGQHTPIDRCHSAKSSQTALGEVSDDNLDAQELPPVDRGMKAWAFCLSSFVLEMMIWGLCFSYGIFQDYYTSYPLFHEASRVSIAAVGTVAIALQYIEAIFISCAFGRYPDYIRLAMWCGLVLYFVSIFCSGFATQVWQLILLQGVGFGISGGLLYVPVIKLLPEWFHERRGLAGGIIFAGGGVGGFVFPYILTALLNKVGLPWTLRIWAIVTSLLCGVALLGLRPRLPVPKYNSGQRRPPFIPPELGFTDSPLFWCVSVTLLLQGFSYFPVSLYIASFAKTLSSPLTATIVLSIFNSAAVGGQIVLGHLSDRYPYPWVMFGSACGSGLAAFLLWGFTKSVVQLYFFAIIFGALSGGFSSTWPNAAYECAKGRSEYTGLAITTTAIARGLSAVLGPVVSAILIESGRGSSMGGKFGRGGYGAVELFVGSCAMATGVGSVLIAVARRNSPFWQRKGKVTDWGDSDNQSARAGRGHG